MVFRPERLGFRFLCRPYEKLPFADYFHHQEDSGWFSQFLTSVKNAGKNIWDFLKSPFTLKGSSS
jgi:hypothetical protein